MDPAPRPAAPKLPGTVVVRADGDDLLDALAADLHVHAVNCVRAFGDFHIALTGGERTAALYTQLMIDPAHRQLPWQRTHLWMVDEAAVAFDDDRSAFRHVRETIVDHSDIPRQQVHPIFPLAEDAAARYERELREALGWREKGHDRLDYVLLALGAAGEASALAGGDAEGGPDRLVRAVRGGAAADPGRISLTLPMINAARFVAVLAVGEALQGAIGRLAAGREGADTLPAAGIRPLGGELRWYLDEDACPH